MRVVEDLTGADYLMNNALFLGTYPGLTRTQIDFEVQVIRDFVHSAV